MSNYAKLLKPDRLSNHNDEDFFKYKIDCSSKISDNNPETLEWLEIKNQIKHNSEEYKILSGILEENKSIVVKVGNNKLSREFEIGKLLDSLNLPTFLSYYCLFKCLDDIKTIGSKNNKNQLNRKHLCRKTGEEITILLMPNIELGSIKDYNWNENNFDILKNILKHIVKSLSYARKYIGFVHNDLHYGNVLLKKTKRKEINYKEFGKLEVNGLLPIIIDYDRSIIYNTQNIQKIDLYNDFIRIINGMSLDTDVVFKILDILNIISKYEKHNITPLICEEICNTIDKINIDYIKSKQKIPDFLKPISIRKP